MSSDTDCTYKLTDFHSWPDNIYLDIVKSKIREEAYTLGYSPCRTNRTYHITFSAPSLRCEDNTPNVGPEALVPSLYENKSLDASKSSNWNPSLAQFMAAPYRSNDQFMFDITYKSSNDHSLKNISCMAMEAAYISRVYYSDSFQTVKVAVKEGQPLNASLLNQPNLFHDVKYSISSRASFNLSDSLYPNFAIDELFAIYHGTQLRAISDTLSQSLAGAISGLGMVNTTFGG